MMGDFFKKLMMARQLKLEDGRIEEFGVRMAFLPTFTLTRLVEKMYEQDGEDAFQFLFDAGTDHGRYIIQEVGGAHNIQKNQFIDQMADSANALGLGKLEVEQFTPGKKLITRITDSPFVESFQDSEVLADLDRPVDDLLLGISHGIAEEIFEAEIVSKETHCVFQGDPYCRLVSKVAD